MPVLQVATNINEKELSENWKTEATDLIAKILEKPKMYIMIHLLPNQNMSMNGTDEPCAYVKLGSIGKINEELNRKYLTEITEFMERTTKVPKDRMYINFEDIQRDMCGFNGNLFKK